jgi:hypothetical protein
MYKLLAVAGGVLLLGFPRVADAGTVFTNPVIYVTPMVLEFGRVGTNRTATATFVVENMGSGKLVGKATVPPPFKIVAGGNYALKANEVQIITITYKPISTAPDTKTVKFTGGGEAKATVTGNSPPQQKTKPKGN